jgi:hypothetical protein
MTASDELVALPARVIASLAWQVIATAAAQADKTVKEYRMVLIIDAPVIQFLSQDNCGRP